MDLSQVPRKTASTVRQWADAGVTWWLESRWNVPHDPGGLEVARRRIREGPPSSG